MMQFAFQVTLFSDNYSQSVFHKKWPSWIKNWHFLCLCILNSSVLNQNEMGIVTEMKFVLAFSIVHMFTSGQVSPFLLCHIFGRYSNVNSNIVNPILSERNWRETFVVVQIYQQQKTLGLSLPIRMGWRLNELGNNSYKYAYESLAWSHKAFLKLKMGLNFRHKLKMNMINCIDK